MREQGAYSTPSSPDDQVPRRCFAEFAIQNISLFATFATVSRAPESPPHGSIAAHRQHLAALHRRVAGAGRQTPLPFGGAQQHEQGRVASCSRVDLRQAGSRASRPAARNPARGCARSPDAEAGVGLFASPPPARPRRARARRWRSRRSPRGEAELAEQLVEQHPCAGAARD